jgi:hypothetical protein
MSALPNTVVMASRSDAGLSAQIEQGQGVIDARIGVEDDQLRRGWTHP